MTCDDIIHNWWGIDEQMQETVTANRQVSKMQKTFQPKKRHLNNIKDVVEYIDI